MFRSTVSLGLGLALTLPLISCSVVKNQTEERPAAALIVGGFWPKNTTQPVANSVELFGCPGAYGQPIHIANFPREVYLTSGVHQHDPEQTLVCGGYNCLNGICGISDACFRWKPDENKWYDDVANFGLGTRWSYMMAEGPNVNASGSNQKTDIPIAIGYRKQTEIFDEATNTWLPYLDLPASNWYALGCLVQDHYGDGKIYQMRDKLIVLDPATWDVDDQYEPVPEAFIAPGKCAVTSINGERGIFIRYGYFYGFESQKWTKKAVPPYNPLEIIPNALFSFRDKPTIFGNPVCDDNGNCENTEVIQYDPDLNEWVSLGHMSHPRSYHEIIEVPGSYCDYFVSPPTSTTPVANSTTTTLLATTSSASTMTSTAAVFVVAFLFMTAQA